MAQSLHTSGPSGPPSTAAYTLSGSAGDHARQSQLVLGPELPAHPPRGRQPAPRRDRAARELVLGAARGGGERRRRRGGALLHLLVEAVGEGAERQRPSGDTTRVTRRAPTTRKRVGVEGREGARRRDRSPSRWNERRGGAHPHARTAREAIPEPGTARDAVPPPRERDTASGNLNRPRDRRGEVLMIDEHSLLIVARKRL